MISYNEFCELFALIPFEPEFEFFFSGRDSSYMLIKYDDRVSFARCGKGSGQLTFYPSLDGLYRSELIDGICLVRDWTDIDTIIAEASYDLSDESDIILLKKIYGII